jgi:acetyl esterase
MAKPELHEMTPEQARIQSNAYYDLLDVRKTRLEHVEDASVPGLAGDIPVRIYKHKKLENPTPVLLFFHGGGFVIGDLDGYDHPCRRLAKIAKCAVISVDYRLAPEHKFPSAIEDCWAVFEWVRKQGSSWGLDTSRIALSGDSAGGNLAAVVAQMARDSGGVQPNLQVLIYPRVDSANITQSGEDLKDRNLVLTDALMSWFKTTPSEILTMCTIFGCPHY